MDMCSLRLFDRRTLARTGADVRDRGHTMFLQAGAPAAFDLEHFPGRSRPTYRGAAGSWPTV